jgi:hypothetical protein
MAATACAWEDDDLFPEGEGSDLRPPTPGRDIDWALVTHNEPELNRQKPLSAFPIPSDNSLKTRTLACHRRREHNRRRRAINAARRAQKNKRTPLSHKSLIPSLYSK